MERAVQLLADKACQLVSGHSTKECFRVLSIGCGDGSFDAKIIQTVTDKFPNINIHYIGTDVDEQICQTASETFASVLKDCNVVVETFAMDFEEVDSFKSRIPLCDMIIAAHVLYYMKDIGKALSDAQMLKRDSGM